MKQRIPAFFLVGLVATLPLFSQAAEVDFSIGGGLPFLVVPEVSIAANNGQQRWFTNYKIGLDDGFSVGFEHALGQDNKHAIGLLIGALGVKNDDRECDIENESNDDVIDAFGSAIGCALTLAFNDETTNGAGLSYSYNFNGLNKAGMRVRFEFGFGKGSQSHDSRFDGGFIISYQF